MAENLSIKGLTGPVEAREANQATEHQDRVRGGGKSSRVQSRYWRRVPSISVLPNENNQIPVNFVLRSSLMVAIVVLVLLTGVRYVDWNDSEVRAEAAEARSQSVKRQLAVRQNEIEPLESQITLLSSKLESAETTYRLATAGQTDWFAAMNGLLSVSVSGVDFLSASVNPDGNVSLVGVATDPGAFASLPNQLSQLSGGIGLQGIQWDADVSPPVFTAGFQVNP